MSFIDKIKKMITKRRQKLLEEIKTGYPKDEYYYKYLKDLQRVKEDIERYKRTLNKTEQSFLRFKNRDFSEYLPEYQTLYKNNNYEYEKELRRIELNCSRWKNELHVSTLKLRFIRPDSKADKDEKRKIEEKFCNNLNKADSNGVLNLRFHGTSIYSAQEIINNGGIFSSMDRLNGYNTSTNDFNQISVTCLDTDKHYFKHGKPHSLSFSMYMMDIAFDSYPAGCMFVLIPRDKEEADMITSSQMHNVDFIKSPETLYAIMTTTENIDRVKLWMKEKGLDSKKVCTMNELVKKIEWDVLKKGPVELKTVNIDRSQQILPKEMQGGDDKLIKDE